MTDGHVIVVDNRFVVQLVDQVAVGQKHILDCRALVGTGENHAQLTDVSVLDLAAIHMLQLISVDAQTVKIPVLQGAHRALRLGVSVEKSFCPDTFRTAVQVRVTQHHVRVIVDVPEYDRDLLAVHIRESTRQNRAAVRTTDVVLGRPSGEIRLAFSCHSLSSFTRFLSKKNKRPCGRSCLFS